VTSCCCASPPARACDRRLRPGGEGPQGIISSKDSTLSGGGQRCISAAKRCTCHHECGYWSTSSGSGFSVGWRWQPGRRCSAFRVGQAQVFSRPRRSHRNDARQSQWQLPASVSAPPPSDWFRDRVLYLGWRRRRRDDPVRLVARYRILGLISSVPSLSRTSSAPRRPSS
jgi:hypothetical protein